MRQLPYDLLARQYGLVTRRQVREHGAGAKSIETWLARGELIPVARGLYRHASVPVTWEQRLLGPCLVGPVVASHRAGGELWHSPLPETGIVEVTAWRWCRRHHPGVRWHESYLLTDANITVVRGIPVTDPTVTLCDLSGVLEPDDLERVLEDALRRGLTDEARIARRFELIQRRPPRLLRSLRAVLERRGRASAVTESDLEIRFLQWMRSHGLPEPVRQYRVVRAGAVVARLDFAWPEVRVGLEVDGLRFHSGRADLERDGARSNRLQPLHWQIYRASLGDLARPTPLLGQLRAALRRSA